MRSIPALMTVIIAAFAVAITGPSAATRPKPPTLDEVARASPEAVKQMLLRSFADDTEIVDAGVAPMIPVGGLTAFVTLRRVPTVSSSGTGICTVEHIELSSYSPGGSSAGAMPLDPPVLRLRTLYKVVGPITPDTTIGASATTTRACKALDRKSLFFLPDDYTVSVHDLPMTGGRLFQEAQRRLGSKDLPFAGDGCGDPNKCIALVRNLDIGLISKLRRSRCWTEADAPVDPACVEYEFEFSGTVEPGGHAGTSHAVTFYAHEGNIGDEPVLLRVQYRLQRWVV